MYAYKPGRAACIVGTYMRDEMRSIALINPVIRRYDDFDYVPIICGAMLRKLGW